MIEGNRLVEQAVGCMLSSPDRPLRPVRWLATTGSVQIARETPDWTLKRSGPKWMEAMASERGGCDRS